MGEEIEKGALWRQILPSFIGKQNNIQKIGRWEIDVFKNTNFYLCFSAF